MVPSPPLGPTPSTFRLYRKSPSVVSDLWRSFLSLVFFFISDGEGLDTDGTCWLVKNVDADGSRRTVFTSRDRYSAERELSRLRGLQSGE